MVDPIPKPDTCIGRRRKPDSGQITDPVGKEKKEKKKTLLATGQAHGRRE